MPGSREVAARRAAIPDAVRRPVMPDAASRSLWLAALWTGVGVAAVCATLAIVAVSVSWLPVSGASGHTMSAVRAGLLTFLAALHGGVTVDGTSAQFVPLGMTVIVGAIAWRAGGGLGDAATSLDETDASRLAVAAGLQAASFTVVALIALPFAHLGTSSAPFLGVAAAGLVLFSATGGVAFVRASALRAIVVTRVPVFVGAAVRAGAAGAAVYFGAGALVVAGSLVLHASRVEALSRQLGGGWGGVPILLLGVLAAPNAVIAGSSYLLGPGFAVGSGAPVNALTTAHGVLPAFPILGAVPQGHGASWYVWVLIVVTPLVAGGCVARAVAREPGWRARLRVLALAAAFAGVGWLVLAWQGGGHIGAGRLSSVGASPWQVGGMVVAQLAVVSAAALAALAGVHAIGRGGRGGASAVLHSLTTTAAAKPHTTAEGGAGANGDTGTTATSKEAGKLAG